MAVNHSFAWIVRTICEPLFTTQVFVFCAQVRRNISPNVQQDTNAIVQKPLKLDSHLAKKSFASMKTLER